MQMGIKNFFRRTSVKSLMIYLIIATFLSTCVTFSKYLVGSTGDGNARVAKMGSLKFVETDSTHGEYLIVPGKKLYKRPEVSFGQAETDVYVFVEMKLGSRWVGKTDFSGEYYDFVIYKEDYSPDTDEDKMISENERLKFSVIQGDDATGWRFVGAYDDNTYVYGITVQANDTLTSRHIIYNDEIYVAPELTQSECDDLDADQGNVDISFRTVAIQKESSDWSMDQAWGSVNASLAVPPQNVTP